MSSELYRDFIDRKADSIINSLGGTITPAPANAELYRDFLDRKFDDVINALNIKHIEREGSGTVSYDIIFPIKPKMILGIKGSFDTTSMAYIPPFIYGLPYISSYAIPYSTGSGSSNRTIELNYSDNILTITGANQNRALNILNNKYDIYYI